MKIIRFSVNDTLELKKPHPCGSSRFSVIRVGSDVRIRCMQCAHTMEIDRIKLEKAIKKVIPAQKDDAPSAVR